MALTPDQPPSTGEVIHRRLIGLMVLLCVVFLLSLLLRGLGGRKPVGDEGLQTVVVPLGDAAPPAAVPLAETTTARASLSQEPDNGPDKGPELPADTVAAGPPEAPPPAVEKRAERVSEAPRIKSPTPEPRAAGRWYVLLGAFSDANNARALAQRARQAGLKVEVSRIASGESSLHRVRAGPYKTEAEGQSARATLIVEGLTTARLSRED